MGTITLAGWAGLAEEQRHELILRWRREGQLEIYEQLAEEAVQILRSELEGIPEISLVELGGGRIISVSPVPEIELVLNVCTLLPGSCQIAQLPAQVAGFRVQQVNLGDRREAYLKTWKRLFKEIKGWSEDRTLKWAESWESSLKSSRSAACSSGPVKMAVPALVDDDTKAFLGGSYFGALCGDIQAVIWGREFGKWPPYLHPDTVDDYDWEYVRRRIKELAGEYKRKKEAAAE